ncbi:hypothetical protein BJ741DRAFT_612907 [Chytriomyces cf. hyalinus JEL632]|nr:hypothetical protein BJ741DRAFT_612907 [Chytriomyces cf. hyalinus JEL632]
MKNKVVFSLGVERNIASTAASPHFPSEIKRLLRGVEHAQANKQTAQLVEKLAALVDLFEQTEDGKQARRYAKMLIECLSSGDNAIKIKGEKGAHYMAGALLSLGRAQLSLMDFDNAIANFEKYSKYSASFSKEDDNRKVSYYAQFNMGLAYLQRGEQKDEEGATVAAKADFQQAQILFKALYGQFDSLWLSKEKRCDVMMNLGIMYGYLGDLERGLACLERSLKLAKELDDSVTIARIYFNLSAIFKKASNLPKALQYLQKALLEHKKINDIEGCLETHFEIAIVQQQLQNYNDALSTMNLYIATAKKLSDNDAVDHGYDVIREINESIGKLQKINQLSNQLVNARKTKAGKRAEFKLIWEMANLKMTLAQYKDALKDFETLNQMSSSLPLNVAETDAITKGLGDANAGMQQYNLAVPYYRTLLRRWTGLTKERAEVLFKESSCLLRCDSPIDQITRPLIECDRIGIHLQNLKIQLEAQRHLSIVFARFQYFERAQRAQARVRDLEAMVEAEGGTDEAYDEEADEDSVPLSGNADVCEEDIVSGSEKDEEAMWVSKAARGNKSKNTPNDGKRTSAIVSKLNLTLSSSPEPEPAMYRDVPKSAVKRKIIPLQSHLNLSQDNLSIEKPERPSLSESDSESDYMLTTDRVKSKRKTALDRLKEQKRRKDAPEFPETPLPHAPSREPRSASRVSLSRVISSSSEASIFDVDYELPDIPPPQYTVGSYRPQTTNTPTVTTSSNRVVSLHSSPIHGHQASESPTTENDNTSNAFVFDDFSEPEDDVVTPLPPKIAQLSAKIAEKQDEMDLQNLSASFKGSGTPSASGRRKPLTCQVSDNSSSASSASRATPKKKSMKVRVQVGSETLYIPCAMMGTPKTVRWLQNEVSRRYRQTHKLTIEVDKLVVDDPKNGNSTLHKEDLLTNVLKNNQTLRAALIE